MESSEKPSPFRPLLAVAVILVATVAALWPVMRCDFTGWDDPETVSKNPLMLSPGVSGALRYWKRPAMGLYIPITYTAWTAIAMVSPSPDLPTDAAQLDPALFHGANLLMHLGSAILVWVILRRLLARATVQEPPAPCIEAAACAGALLFALHPIQVEPVAWVSGLKDLLSGFFSLVAIWQYLAFVDAPLKTPGRTLRYWIVLVAAGLAMLSKPSAMVLPVILAILDLFVLRRSMRDVARGALPVLAVCLPCTILAMVIQHPARAVAIWQRPAVVLDSLSFYAVKLFWPLKLAPDYGHRPVDALHDRLIWFCWVIPLLLVAALGLIRRRVPLVVVGVCIFVAAILPTLGFTNTLFQDKSTVADHYLYLGMLGIALVLAAILVRWKSTPLVGVVSLALIACGVLSFRQIGYWRDSMSLLSHDVQVSPRTWSMRLGLAQELVKQQQFARAETLTREAVEIYPSSRTYLALGQVLLLSNRPADAIEPIQQALEFEPGIENGELSLASAYLGAKQPREAARVLETYLQEHPDDPRATEMLQAANSASSP